MFVYLQHIYACVNIDFHYSTATFYFAFQSKKKPNICNIETQENLCPYMYY